MEKEIFVFGDSIVYGFFDLTGGWVQRLRVFIDQDNIKRVRETGISAKSNLVYQLGRSGNRSVKVLQRFESEVEKRTIKRKETIIIFQIGINDSEFINLSDQNKVSLEDFSKNIQKTVDRSRKFTSKIVFVGLTPIDESRVDPIPWVPEHSYKNKEIQKYNQKIKEICEKNKVYFIELFDEIFDERIELLEDGVHPNSEGHEKIFQIVKKYLIKNEII